MKQIRLNPTNSANDSKGLTFGLKGDQFLFIVSGLVGGIVVLLLIMQLGGSPVSGLLAGCLPVGFSILFLIIFKIGKPPAYMSDVIQKWCGKKYLKRSGKVISPYIHNNN